MNIAQLVFWVFVVPVVVAVGFCLWLKALAVVLPALLVSLLVLALVAAFIGFLGSTPRYHGPTHPQALPPGAAPHPGAYRTPRPRRPRRQGP